MEYDFEIVHEHGIENLPFDIINRPSTNYLDFAASGNDRPFSPVTLFDKRKMIFLSYEI